MNSVTCTYLTVDDVPLVQYVTLIEDLKRDLYCNHTNSSPQIYINSSYYGESTFYNVVSIRVTAKSSTSSTIYNNIWFFVD